MDVRHFPRPSSKLDVVSVPIRVDLPRRIHKSTNRKNEKRTHASQISTAREKRWTKTQTSMAREQRYAAKKGTL